MGWYFNVKFKFVVINGEGEDWSMPRRLPLVAQTLGLSALLAAGIFGQAMAQDYPPNGPDIPVITVNEDSSGAYDQDLKQEPAPNPPDQQSIWNMKVVGFNDNQARPVYQPLIVDEDGRYIAYMGNLAGVILNPLTGAME